MPQAAWIATEFFSEFRGGLGITLTPVDDGRLELYLNDELIFDRKAEDGKYPDLDRVRTLKAVVKNKI